MRHPAFRSRTGPGCVVGIVAVAWIVAGASPVLAQAVIDGTEDLSFDRPEAWAQKYFAAVTQFGGFGVARSVDAGSVEVALEGSWVPSLSVRERTVGFNGVKEEDLNKTDVFGRLRCGIGLPARVVVTLAYTPPIELNGAEPELFALSIGRPFRPTEKLRLGLRLHGQTGKVTGDFTCPRDVVEAGLDPVANPFLCEEPSRDGFHPRYVGLEMAGALPLRGGRLEPYLVASANRLSTEFRIRALYSGLEDRTVLRTSGWTWSAAAGGDVAIGTHWHFAGEWYYAPLDVVRPPSTSSSNDALLNVRLMVSRRLR